jgi:hypothetical protein
MANDCLYADLSDPAAGVGAYVAGALLFFV